MPPVVGVNDEALADLCMGWEEIAQLAADPLVTIGAHTVNHVMLKKISTESTARSEMEMSREVIEAALGVRPLHLAYPVGDPTSAGQREFCRRTRLQDRSHHAAKRVVQGASRASHRVAPDLGQCEFQQQRYLKVLISGAATAMWNGFRRVDAA